MPTSVFLPPDQAPLDYLTAEARRILKPGLELLDAAESVPGEIYFLIRDSQTGCTSLRAIGYEHTSVDRSGPFPVNFSYGHLWGEHQGMYFTLPPKAFVDRLTPLPDVDEAVTSPLMAQLDLLDAQATPEAGLQACDVEAHLRTLDPDFVARRYRRKVRAHHADSRAAWPSPDPRSLP